MIDINSGSVYTLMESDDNTIPPIIKHLVIAGGGTYGFSAYGALKETHKHGIWDIKNIESCYCTSIGALLSVIIFLGYEWETLDNYFIKRPWSTVLKYDIHTIINSYEKCGVFDHTLLNDALKPLFLGADISLDITMREFFDKTGVTMNIFTGELNEFKLVCISHTTHPDWRVMDALYASASIPIFFKPLCIDNSIFVDGAVFLNYPLVECLKHPGVNPREVLGIKKITPVANIDMLDSNTNLIDYTLFLVNKLLTCAEQHRNEEEPQIENEIHIAFESVAVSGLYEFANSEKRRVELIQIGVDAANIMIESRRLRLECTHEEPPIITDLLH